MILFFKYIITIQEFRDISVASTSFICAVAVIGLSTVGLNENRTCGVAQMSESSYQVS